MLNILDEKEIRTSESIENEYKHCKFILTDYSGLENPSGRLYCVSTSDESYREICRIANQFARQNIPSILMGSYDNGGGPGVQYEVEG